MGGRGLGRWLWGQGAGAPTAEEQKGWLRRQADLLKGQLEEVTRRLSDLEKTDK